MIVAVIDQLKPVDDDAGVILPLVYRVVGEQRLGPLEVVAIDYVEQFSPCRKIADLRIPASILAASADRLPTPPGTSAQAIPRGSPRDAESLSVRRDRQLSPIIHLTPCRAGRKLVMLE